MEAFIAIHYYAHLGVCLFKNQLNELVCFERVYLILLQIDPDYYQFESKETNVYYNLT